MTHQEKCDYCLTPGHDTRTCPHFSAHLLDPSPKWNAIRAFVRVLGKHGIHIAPAVPNPDVERAE